MCPGDLLLHFMLSPGSGGGFGFKLVVSFTGRVMQTSLNIKCVTYPNAHARHRKGILLTMVRGKSEVTAERQ